MGTEAGKLIPRPKDLIVPVFSALKKLDGSGSNEEILKQVVSDLQLPEKAVDIPHSEKSGQSELQYQLGWAKFLLRWYGVIENSARTIWAIKPEYMDAETVDPKKIMKAFQDSRKTGTSENPAEKSAEAEEDPQISYPEEYKHWRVRLTEILQTMDPYGFERLAQRVLRESGFTKVEVTKKSGDGGIDGVGKLQINGIFSFNVAFQCKRYSGVVGAPVVRDFRGSLTTNIEKGVLITTGTFSQAAKEEAANPGKQQIDLIDGEAFIDRIVECGVGVREVKTYEIDEEFFWKI